MFSVFVNTISSTIPLSIAPTTTIGEIKRAICESQKMSADQFELALQDQHLTDVTMTADACGITRDCFITVLEKPMNQVRYFMILIFKFSIAKPLPFLSVMSQNPSFSTHIFTSISLYIPN